jgi:hypothetical protein
MSHARPCRSRASSDLDLYNGTSPRLIPSKSANSGHQGSSAGSSLSNSPATSYFMQTVGGYLLPSEYRRPSAAAHTAEESSDALLWLHIQRLRSSSGAQLTFVLQGYCTGFQMFDASGTVARELASSRTGEAVRCATLFGPWNGGTAGCGSAECSSASSSNSSSGSMRSRLAVVTSATAASTAADVRIFCLDQHRYTHTVVHGEGEVHGVAGSESALAVALSREVRVDFHYVYQLSDRLTASWQRIHSGCFVLVAIAASI